MDDKRSEVFNAHQGIFGSQWLNVAPCKNPGLKLDDQQLRISIGLCLGANICVAHRATVETMGPLDLLSMLEPRGLYRTDGKRPDVVFMIPWEMKQLVWDVTVVDALASSRLNEGSLCNPGTIIMRSST